MGPTFSASNYADVWSTDFVVVRQLELGTSTIGIPFADFKNLFIGELAYSAMFAERMTVILYGILDVIESRIPSKIFYSVVSWISVFMATVVIKRAWADESSKDDSMNIILLAFQAYNQVSASFPSWASILAFPATYSLKFTATNATEYLAVACRAMPDVAWNMASSYPRKLWKRWQLRQHKYSFHGTTIINIFHSVKYCEGN